MSGQRLLAEAEVEVVVDGWTLEISELIGAEDDEPLDVLVFEVGLIVGVDSGLDETVTVELELLLEDVVSTA